LISEHCCKTILRKNFPEESSPQSDISYCTVLGKRRAKERYRREGKKKKTVLGISIKKLNRIFARVRKSR
jgi:hypothetical protein